MGIGGHSEFLKPKEKRKEAGGVETAVEEVKIFDVKLVSLPKHASPKATMLGGDCYQELLSGRSAAQVKRYVDEKVIPNLDVREGYFPYEISSVEPTKIRGPYEITTIHGKRRK